MLRARVEAADLDLLLIVEQAEVSLLQLSQQLPASSLAGGLLGDNIDQRQRGPGMQGRDVSRRRFRLRCSQL
jgi:hypothetical protein